MATALKDDRDTCGKMDSLSGFFLPSSIETGDATVCRWSRFSTLKVARKPGVAATDLTVSEIHNLIIDCHQL